MGQHEHRPTVGLPAHTIGAHLDQYVEAGAEVSAGRFVTVQVRTLQFNACTMKQLTGKRAIAKQLRIANMNVAIFQETRQVGDAICELEGFIVATSSAVSGSGGCAIWVSHYLPSLPAVLVIPERPVRLAFTLLQMMLPSFMLIRGVWFLRCTGGLTHHCRCSPRR